METDLDDAQDDEDLDEEDDFDEKAPIVHIKYIAEGLTTLSEVARALRGYADYCESVERLGWQLSQPVDNAYCIVEWVGEGPPQYPPED